MKALVVHEFGPLEHHKVEEWPSPAVGASDVLIDVHAIGLNFPDNLMLQGKYQTRPDRPFVPGRDLAPTSAPGWWLRVRPMSVGPRCRRT